MKERVGKKVARESSRKTGNSHKLGVAEKLNHGERRGEKVFIYP